MTNTADSTLQHLIRIGRSAAAAGHPGPLSSGEALAAALLLNRPDWLAELGYTIVEALDRIGPAWAARLGAAVAALAHEADVAAVVRDGLARAAVRPTPAASADAEPTVLNFAATLVTTGSAPGYRDATLVLDLREIGGAAQTVRANVSIRPDDAEDIVAHLRHVHRFAWRRGAPIDQRPGEERPRWIDG